MKGRHCSFLLTAAVLAALLGTGCAAPATAPAATPSPATAAPTAQPTAAPATGTTPAPTSAPTETPGGFDLDLTQMSSTLVYAEVFNMLDKPDDYAGKTVKMRGQAAVYLGPTQDGQETYYFAVVIPDATACCQQGVEYVLAGGSADPADYPAEGAEVTVTGTFAPYQENNWSFGHLVDAEVLDKG